MLRTRVMPCLLLRGSALVKTIRFKDASYIGDPVNTVRIFNEKEVDELIVLDITATPNGTPPRFELIEEIAGECFMPVCYGGGITSVDQMRRILQSGIEKVALNTAALADPSVMQRAADAFGSQCIVASLDVKRSRWRGEKVFGRGGRERTALDPVEAAQRAEAHGAGEILLTSIDRDGTMSGYDLDLVRRVAEAVSIPVVANGGAGEVTHFRQAVDAGASAVAAGSMVVYQGPHRAVMISFPDRGELRRALG